MLRFAVNWSDAKMAATEVMNLIADAASRLTKVALISSELPPMPLPAIHKVASKPRKVNISPIPTNWLGTASKNLRSTADL